jgi:hypothetical protein
MSVLAQRDTINISARCRGGAIAWLDALDDTADIAAVEHMRDIGHRNNEEAAGVG